MAKKKKEYVQILTREFDDRGEKIIAIGELKSWYFIIGVLLSVLLIAFIAYNFFTREPAQTTQTAQPTASLQPGASASAETPAEVPSDPFSMLDIIIVASCGAVLYYCAKQLWLNRKRALTLTEKRVYGHTGEISFDIPLSEITAVAIKEKRNFIAGDVEYLKIQTETRSPLEFEQLKNMKYIRDKLQIAVDRLRQSEATN